jgi:hypothetical protein
VELEVGADGHANAPPSGTAAAAPPAGTEKQYIITSITDIYLLLLEPTLPEHKLVPLPAVLFLDFVGETLSFIYQRFVTSHNLPTTPLL